MSDERWCPHVSVAAVAERDGHFLLVEERKAAGLVLNQPAGHLEAGESLCAAVVRETLEETAWHFVPTALVGIYRWSVPADPATVYMRFAFRGELSGRAAGRSLDADIERTLWLPEAALRAQAARHRSPLVWRCVADYLAGRRYPLDLLVDVDLAVAGEGGVAGAE